MCGELPYYDTCGTAGNGCSFIPSVTMEPDSREKRVQRTQAGTNCTHPFSIPRRLQGTRLGVLGDLTPSAEQVGAGL